mmetsp:Transcript_73653/g.192208  ORF Transcript_73653/g.192208 Transcript_73653/m.192208 type:complete len:260 (+) Transcript_73653:992-1771(+)
MHLLDAQEAQGSAQGLFELHVEMRDRPGLLPVPVMQHQREQEGVELVVLLVGVVAALRGALEAVALRATSARRARVLVGARVRAVTLRGVEGGRVRIAVDEADLPRHGGLQHPPQGAARLAPGSQWDVRLQLHGAVPQPHLPDVAGGDEDGAVVPEEGERLARRVGEGLRPHAREGMPVQSAQSAKVLYRAVHARRLGLDSSHRVSERLRGDGIATTSPCRRPPPCCVIGVDVDRARALEITSVQRYRSPQKGGHQTYT